MLLEDLLDSFKGRLVVFLERRVSLGDRSYVWCETSRSNASWRRHKLIVLEALIEQPLWHLACTFLLAFVGQRIIGGSGSADAHQVVLEVQFVHLVEELGFHLVALLGRHLDSV